MKARITWDAGWGATSIEANVSGIGEAVKEALAMVDDAIDSNVQGAEYYAYTDALHESGEVEVIVRVKSVSGVAYEQSGQVVGGNQT